MARRITLLTLVAVLTVAALSLASKIATAETKAERFQAAVDLVKEALHREVYGQTDDRQQLLEDALAKSPDLEAAHWHLGHVNEKGKWVDFQEAADLLQANKKLDVYRRLRDEAEDTVDGQFQLADWCRRNKLVDQERAHLSRVVELSPDHLDARARMGHIRVGGEWLTADERRGEFERVVEMRKALADWRPVMRDIARGLSRRGELQREAAAAKLLATGDPTAIGAMEEVISPLGEDAAKLVIEAIAVMEQHDASVALARQAVYSPHVSVRELACEKLKGRSTEGFVPQLLAELQTPVVSRSQLYRGRGGSLVSRQVLAREGQDHRDLAVLETEYERIARMGGDADDTLARALTDLQRTAIMRDVALSRENTQTAAMNLRVMNVLEQSTGEMMPPLPQNWWTWWNDENEVFVQTDKPIRQTYQRDTVAVVDRTPLDSTGPQDQRETGPATQATPVPRFSGDCLAAGTKVWTELGPLAIEEIRVGDRVLAQDPDTGELAYKPVLGTTIRPASRLVRITAGQDSITTSGGHLYWTAGEGWQKARELASGGELHSIRGSVRISQVEKAELAPTYNLIVADFHTYFVGASHVLCHDNTLREPTDALVPGLSDY